MNHSIILLSNVIMEGVPAGYLASALIPIVYDVGCWIWSNCNDISKRKKLVLILPKKCGKSMLNKCLTGQSDSLMLVDLDEVMKSRSDAEKFLNLEIAERKHDFSTSKILKLEMVKDTVDYVQKIWLNKKKDNRALFLSSDVSVCKSIFKESSICLAIPSDKLFKQMCDNLTESDAESLRLSRLNYLKSYNPDQY